jgi:hypothetical protein
MKRKMNNIKRPSRAAGFVNSGKGNAWRANRVCLAIVLLALHQITTYFCVTQKRYNFGSVVSIPLFFSGSNGARGFGRRPSYVPYGSMRWTRRVRGHRRSSRGRCSSGRAPPLPGDLSDGLKRVKPVRSRSPETGQERSFSGSPWNA